MKVADEARRAAEGDREARRQALQARSAAQLALLREMEGRRAES